MTHPRAHVFDFYERLEGSDAHVMHDIEVGMTDDIFHSHYGKTKEMARRIIVAFKLMQRPRWNTDLLLDAIALSHFPFTSEISVDEQSRNAKLLATAEIDIKNAKELGELDVIFSQQSGLRWMREKGYFFPSVFLQKKENVLAMAEAPKLDVMAEVEVPDAAQTKDDRPPGPLPKTANGLVAVSAAWELELGLGSRPTAKQVMTLLRTWADTGKRADVLKKSGPDGISVVWQTGKGKEKNYSLEALEKNLEKWWKSRI